MLTSLESNRMYTDTTRQPTGMMDDNSCPLQALT